MYAHIKGTVDSILTDRVILETGGVGFELICSTNSLRLLHTGDTVKLFTHFYLSQDSIALYGFHSDEERAMFRRLISVSRIGPKVALSALSVLSPEDVALAVLTDNVATFDSVSGMGRKTAARVILELKGKVDSISSGVPEAIRPSDTAAAMRTEVISALVSLGYDGATAGRAVANIPDCERAEDMLRLALRSLSAK